MIMKKLYLPSFRIILLCLVITSCSNNAVVGPQGPQGEQGIQGETGQQGPQGEKGEGGKSAYDIYIENYPDYKGTESEWLDDLINGRLGEKITHTVNFNSNGGSDVSSQIIVHGEKAVKPDDPNRVGYTFVDWVDENNDHWVFNGFSITSDITLTAVWSETYPYSKIQINEICSKNRKSFVDKYGEDSDWIELYNSSNTILNLNGCGLSNDQNSPYLLKFDDVYIEPDSYLVVAVSGRDKKVYEGEYHAPFTLSQKKGGTIFFSAPYELIDSITYPALKDDVSYGRIGDEWSTLLPSAGLQNESVYVERQILDAPTFSVPSGIYESEFDLTITSKDGYRIFYTVDSSTPNEDSTMFFEPIHIYDKSSEENVVSKRKDVSGSNSIWTPSNPVQKCFVIRAICYDDYGNYSPVVSSSYWIGQNNFIQKGTAVMSLSTDFNNLFDYEMGIYCNGKKWDDWHNSEEYDSSLPSYRQPANYTQKGFDWERLANITFLNEKHNLKCEQNVGMRIKGGATRANVKKSFNLYTRFLYDGKTKFDYKFNGRKCESISLRSGGNDSNLLITDSINSMIAKKYNLDFATQESTPTYLFLNGEFWGLYFIVDKYDSKFIEEEYGVDDSIIWKALEIEEGYMSDISVFQEADKTIGQRLLTPEGYTDFENSFRVSSLVDAIIFESYIDNTDFHLFGNNSAFWRSRNKTDVVYSDGLFRFMLFDTDFALGRSHGYQDYPSLLEKIGESTRYNYLLQSQTFVDLLKNRANELVPLFSSEDCLSMISDYYDKVKTLIEIDSVRFGRTISIAYDRWNTVYSFLENRGKYYLDFINQL